MSYTFDQSLFFAYCSTISVSFFYLELNTKAADGDNTVQKWEAGDKCEILDNFQNAVIWELWQEN